MYSSGSRTTLPQGWRLQAHLSAQQDEYNLRREEGAGEVDDILPDKLVMLCNHPILWGTMG